MRKTTKNALFVGLGLLALVCLIGASLLLLTGEEPDEQAVLVALGEELPVYWSVESVTISVSSESEVEGFTTFRQRFEAIAAPREDLYVAAPHGANIEPFAVISAKSTPSKKYKLHGIATSTLKLDRWSTEIALDNSVGDLGVPRSAFAAPVLVAGSEEAARVTRQLNAARDLAAKAAAALSNGVKGAPVQR